MSSPQAPAANSSNHLQHTSQAPPSAHLQDAMHNLHARLNFVATVLENPYASTQVLSPLSVAHTLRIFEANVALTQRDFEAHDQKRVGQVVTADGTVDRQFQSRGVREPSEPLVESQMKKEKQREDEFQHNVAKVNRQGRLNENKHRHGDLGLEKGEDEVEQTEEHTPKRRADTPYQQAIKALNAIETEYLSEIPALKIGSMAEITFLKSKIEKLYAGTAEAMAQHHRNVARANEQGQTDGHGDLDQGGVEETEKDTHISQADHQEALDTLDTKYLAQLNELQTKHAAQMSFLRAEAKRLSDENTLLKSCNETEKLSNPY